MVGEKWNTTKPRSLKRRVAETAELEIRSRSHRRSHAIVEPVSPPAPAVLVQRPPIAPHCSLFSFASISVHQPLPGCLVRSTGLSRRLLIRSAAGAIVELVSPPAPAVHLAPSNSSLLALRSVHLPDQRWTSLVMNFLNGFPSPGTTHRSVFPIGDALVGFGSSELRSGLAIAGSVSSGRPLRKWVAAAIVPVLHWKGTGEGN
jgi:hypothetical protein